MKQILAVILFCLLLAHVHSYGQIAPTGKWLWIQSAAEVGESELGYFDVPGKIAGIGANEIHNVTVYEIDGGTDRQYQVIHVKDDKYQIYAGHSGETHVLKMEETFNKNGANFQIEKRVDLGDKDIFNRQRFSLIYQGAGAWKIYSDDGRIICLDGKSSKNGTNVHLWEDHKGLWTEWVFTDSQSKKIIYPEIANNLNHISVGGKIKNPVANATIKSIDDTHLQLYNAERELFKYLPKISESKKIIDQTSHFSSKFDRLNTEVSRLEEVLTAFNRIPVIGKATLVLSKGVGMIASPVGKVNIAIAKTDEEVVSPAHGSVHAADNSIVDYEKELVQLMYKLEKMKEIYITAALAVEDDKTALISFNQNSEKLNAVLKAVPNELELIINELSKIDNMTKDLKKIEKTANALDKGITKFEKVFHEIDKVGKEVDKVLSAEFDAKVVKLSLKKALTGSVLPDEVKDKFKKWSDGLIKPLIKKLNIKIPEVPGVDEFKNEIKIIENKIASVKQSSVKLEESRRTIPAISEGLEAPFLSCLQAVPYDKMVKFKLVDKSEY
ncbi:MAG: RICIN domain-containing protein [Melioribacteraceae bacterium]|nr:RICIN domain-containing protein [Melioribacteraceae bacterium]